MRFLVPLLLISCATEADFEPFGVRADPILNGTLEPQVLPLSPGEQLAIGWLADPAAPSSPFCTGTLIGRRAVATARHCLCKAETDDGICPTPPRSADELVFGVGRDPSLPERVFPVAEVHYHEEVDATVLVLFDDVVRVLPGVTPIPANLTSLDSTWGASLVGTIVDVAGYGDTRDPTRTGRWFAAVRLREILPDFVEVDGEGQQGLCFGDSGGPVIAASQLGDPVLLGVESAGEDSCVGRDRLTRLDAIKDWLGARAAPALEQPCGDVDYLGRCTGEVAEWCNGDSLERTDCAEQQQVCGFVDERTGYYCGKLGSFPERAVQAQAVLKGYPGCTHAPPSGVPPWALLLVAARRRRSRQFGGS